MIDQLIYFVLHLNSSLGVFVSHYGAWVYALLFFIVFCQTGVVLMALLPGDSLLFAAGAVAATGAMNLGFLLALLTCAAILGNSVNYFVGGKFGHLLLKMNDSIFFKKTYIEKTHAFFERHGSKAVILALFVPIVRTFTPFLAGLGKMRLAKFMLCNVIGVSIWVGLIVSVSFVFGNIPLVKNNFSLVILAIIFVSLLPGFFSWFRRLRRT